MTNIKRQNRKNSRTLKKAEHKPTNTFIFQFDIKEVEKGKFGLQNTTFSLHADQFPSLLLGDKDLTQFGINTLLEGLTYVIEKVADLHEENTGIPASKTKEMVISKLEPRRRKKVKLIGI